MNDYQKVYCDGAAMAYKDAAAEIRHLMANAPEELKEILLALEPVAVACERKAIEVYAESERFNARRLQ